MSGIDEVRGAIHGDGYLLGRPLPDGDSEAFQARHDRLSGNYVVRLFPTEIYSRNELAIQVQSEARRASLLRHPGVAQVLDFNVSGEQPVFVVTESVGGRSLEQVIAEEGMLPFPRAIDLVDQIADALRAAHGLGLIHGDLHPASIRLIEGAGGRPTAKVLGFGWAKELHGGNRKGKSWVYQAPEMQSPMRRPADERADQFSLAAITYEMLAGCPPFADESDDPEDDTDRTNPGFGVFRMPPPLSEFVMGLPAGIDTVLAKAFSPEPRDRYPRLEDFTAALRKSAGMNPAPPPGMVDPEATPLPTAKATRISSPHLSPPPMEVTPTQVAPGPTPPPEEVSTVVTTDVPLPPKLSTPIQLGFLGTALVLVIGSITVMAQTQRKVPPTKDKPAIAAIPAPIDLPPPAPAPIPKAAIHVAEPEPPPAVTSEESAGHRRSRRGSHHGH